MPAPSIIVTLEDAAGQEWPVRVWYTIEDWRRASDSTTLQVAQDESDRLAKLEPKWRPILPVKITKVEPLNQELN